jgi:hypothetical protein
MNHFFFFQLIQVLSAAQKTGGEEGAAAVATWLRSPLYRGLAFTRHVGAFLCLAVFQLGALLAVASRFQLLSGVAAACGGLPDSPVVAAVAACERGLQPIGAGLCANASGHASYMLFRAASLVKGIEKRQLYRARGYKLALESKEAQDPLLAQLPYGFPYYNGYRFWPVPELEYAMLIAGAVAMLLAPSPRVGPVTSV